MTLSQPYFRSVAELMADAAEAIQHAHDAGFVHRDLKPSNIMVDGAGQSWIIDFGLAGYVQRAESPNGAAGAVLADPEPLTTTGLLGTPHYMAPEQVEGKADHLSDVWGLGATLYELCTLRRPFEADSVTALQSQILSDTPPRPRGLVRNLPADLAAICLKSLQKGPVRRYASAGEFATDLRRWLRHEPTVARPARTPRRLWLWSRRNPGWAASFVLLVLLLLTIGLNLWAQTRELGLQLGETKEQLRLKVKQVALEELGQLLQSRVTNHDDGSWSSKVWKRVTRAAQELGADLDLRNHAAASLAGLDAARENTFSFSASSVAFHRDGKKLLMGGTAEKQMGGTAEKPAQPARLWDGTLNEPMASKLTGQGPVAFGDDGTPLQLVVRRDGTLVLWDVAKQSVVREPKVPPAVDLSKARLALSSDGSLIAASAGIDKGKNKTWVWRSRSEEPVHEFDLMATALAFSSDGKLFAAGADDGSIRIWAMPQGKLLSHLEHDRAEILALTFGRDPRRPAGQGSRDQTWLLASGDATGRVVIWDLQHATVRSICLGSEYHIRGIDFSPDGMTIAAAARGPAKLWDVATGRLLLELDKGYWLTGVTFSPDGTKLAVSSIDAFDVKGKVSIWAMEPGRGIQTLRGLAAHVEQVVFSPNEQLVAAISHDSRVGLWDLKGNKLLHVFEAPMTEWVDNAGLTFSPDNRHLAYSGSRQGKGRAVLWAVDSGKEISAWDFNAGLRNVLAFHPDEKLLLFQSEKHHDRFDSKPQMYELPVGKPARPLWTKTAFDRGIASHAAPADARYVAIVGSMGDNAVTRVIKAYDGITGEELWASAVEKADKTRLAISLDRSGRFLTVHREHTVDSSKTHAILLQMPSGKYLGPTEHHGGKHWNPSMPLWLDPNHQRYSPSLTFLAQGKKDPAIVLAMDARATGVTRPFSADGGRFAWGNGHGSVHVADFLEIRKRLTEVGLEW